MNLREQDGEIVNAATSNAVSPAAPNGLARGLGPGSHSAVSDGVSVLVSSNEADSVPSVAHEKVGTVYISAAEAKAVLLNTASLTPRPFSIGVQL